LLDRTASATIPATISTARPKCVISFTATERREPRR
jgi:hypothetical protein